MMLAHTDQHRLMMYTLYNSPRDHPGKYVLRRSFMIRGNNNFVAWLSRPDDIIIKDNVHEIDFLMFRHGFVWQVRQLKDDPVIMGVYL